MAELKELIIKRGQLKAQLTRFSTFIANLDEKKSIQLETRIEKMETIFKEFLAVQSRIEILHEDDSEFNEREEFENKFYETISEAKQHLSKQGRKEVPNDNIVMPNPINYNYLNAVKLPTLNLPTFLGDYDKWLQFKDTFMSLVHNNKNLDDIQKFYYLLGCLQGDAEKLLQNLNVTNENYTIAWDLLQGRYENKPVIIQSHLRGLFDMSPLNRECHTLLRRLVDNIHRHLRALKSLKEPVDSWDRVLIFMLARKLDSNTKMLWEEENIEKYNGLPTITDFCTFLRNRCQVLETVDLSNKVKSYPRRNTDDRAAGAHVSTYGNVKCSICEGAHFISQCEKFQILSIADRYDEIMKLKLCVNCLRSNHYKRTCRADGCEKCGRKHNTWLHRDYDTNVQGEVSNVRSNNSNMENVIEEPEASINAHSQQRLESRVLLATAVVQIADIDGKYYKCRALLDSGSQSNFMSTDLMHKLKLKASRINLPIIGVNENKTNIRLMTQTRIKSCHNAYKTDLQFLILDAITSNIPSCSLSLNEMKIPKNLNLADPEFNVSSKVDILLGASIFFELLCVGQIKLGTGMPVLQKSLLGWVISGPMTSSLKSNVVVCNVSVNQSVQEQLTKFWNIEECSNTKFHSREEVECEKHFLSTHTRDVDGRFVVTLPIREHTVELGNSLECATKRLYSVERKLAKNSEVERQYREFMYEYESLGHMEKINSHVETKSASEVYYLPHHFVLNDNSITTKLRVVFDASAKTTSGVSLNNILKVGPTIQDDLFEILVRFRKHNVVMTADIAKMYRQVRVVEQQRDLQRIVWISNRDDPIQHYRCNTLTYGTATASFLAIRCLHQTALDNAERYPDASKVILKDFYVDDLISGADTVEKARQLKCEISSIVAQGKFELRKWVSNDFAVFNDVGSQDESNLQYYISDDETKKTLGVYWNSKLDSLGYVVQAQCKAKVTKRFILSTISKIFDPLGLVGPCTIQAKIILQQLWGLKLGWDDSITTDLFSRWSEFYNNLVELNDVCVPRQVVIKNSTNTQIHGFSDASEKAYGCCVYIRTTNDTGEIAVILLCAKSKVAPLKTISLPRLELCGAVLLARLVHKVMEALNMSIHNTFYWTDSQIVLSWLKSQPCTWKTFIANRVSEIQTLTDTGTWRHISSEENPADIISRGATPSMLMSSNLWWSGPDFLKDNSRVWPNEVFNDNDIPERKNNVVLVNVVSDLTMFTRFSSLYKLQRITALCLRFYDNLRSRGNGKVTGELSVEELNRALATLIRVMQIQEFHGEISDLEANRNVAKRSKLITLSPFLDERDQLIRVGGRLSEANVSNDVKYPIILSDKHPLTRLIVLHEHHRNLHAGPQAILACLRNRYWPLNGRRVVRSVLRSCVTCFRAKPRDITRKMGNLPIDRVTPNRPFLICGVDYAGPFEVKDGKLRNRKLVKAYMCLFVCFSTKAVHIELVGDLTTDSFLNALKRFIARRGLCSTIYSDNGTNFVGASNKLKEINEALNKICSNREITEFCNKREIKWRFIPPRSPHQGGLWESAVKSAKYHAVRVVGNAQLTFEEMSTVFAQIEAVLNSRPITPLSSDPNDLFPLTPGHFLIGDSLTAIAEVDIKAIPTNRLHQYQRLQQIVQHFWSRWSREYLGTLQQRTKWQSNDAGGLKVGTMVVVKEDNSAPLNWKLGRVVELHPGPDNIVRVVTVKTHGGAVFKRSVQKLCMLPIENPLYVH